MAVLRIVKKTRITRIMSIISTHMFNSCVLITVTISFFPHIPSPLSDLKKIESDQTF